MWGTSNQGEFMNFKFVFAAVAVCLVTAQAHALEAKRIEITQPVAGVWQSNGDTLVPMNEAVADELDRLFPALVIDKSYTCLAKVRKTVLASNLHMPKCKDLPPMDRFACEGRRHQRMEELASATVLSVYELTGCTVSL